MPPASLDFSTWEVWYGMFQSLEECSLEPYFAAKPLRTAKLQDAKGMFRWESRVFIDPVRAPSAHTFQYFSAQKNSSLMSKPDVVRVLNEYRVNMKEDLLAPGKFGYQQLFLTSCHVGAYS
jgi:hypothetical protein